MKRSTILMIIWGIVVIILIALLTIMGFIVGNRAKDYKELEKKLELVVKDSNIDLNILNNGQITINKEDLLDLNLIDEKDMIINNDECDGYVKITYDKKYSYKAYLKCKKYETEKSW